MNMPGASPFRIGCQTFTWEMLGSDWRGKPDDLLAAIAAGGYAGIEITDRMIGDYAARPEAFAAALAAHGLALVALAIASESGFSEADAVEGDLEAVRRWTGFLGRFPAAVLSMGSATEVSEGARDAKIGQAADLYNRAGEIGRQAGVAVAVHPSSHHRTLLFDRADYDRLFTRLDPGLVGWVPDTGHILRGHGDMLDTLATHRDRIRYLHLKDVDEAGRWAMLGAGRCDVVAVAEVLRGAPRFNGWLVVEEESDEAAADPAKAVARNRETLRRLLA